MSLQVTMFIFFLLSFSSNISFLYYFSFVRSLLNVASYFFFFFWQCFIFRIQSLELKKKNVSGLKKKKKKISLFNVWLNFFLIFLFKCDLFPHCTFNASAVHCCCAALCVCVCLCVFVCVSSWWLVATSYSSSSSSLHPPRLCPSSLPPKFWFNKEGEMWVNGEEVRLTDWLAARRVVSPFLSYFSSPVAAPPVSRCCHFRPKDLLSEGLLAPGRRRMSHPHMQWATNKPRPLHLIFLKKDLEKQNHWGLCKVFYREGDLAGLLST